MGIPIFRSLLLMLFFSVFSLSFSHAAEPTRTIIDDWNTIPSPPAPAIQMVSVTPETTAFLILDMQSRTCNSRPRCLFSVDVVTDFLAKVRTKNMCVVYSLTSTGTPADILSSLAPQSDDPIVQASVDKFYHTDLDAILHQRGITTVIISGTAAHGAVLHTAVAAAIRGYKVIVPLDGMSAESLYAEQYTAWHLTNSPGTINKVVLTSFSLINIL